MGTEENRKHRVYRNIRRYEKPYCFCFHSDSNQNIKRCAKLEATFNYPQSKRFLFLDLVYSPADYPYCRQDKLQLKLSNIPYGHYQIKDDHQESIRISAMSSTAVSTNSDRQRRNNDDTMMTDNNKKSSSDNNVSSSSSSQKTSVITPQTTKSKKSKKQRAKIVAATITSLDHRMAVENNVVDELLLVCGVIGTTTNSGNGNELVPVTDCLNWLQDLQRALRRDEDSYRPISLLLGKWKIVEQKLLPLVVTCRYDTPIVLTVLKILVILTKPLAENSQRAGQMIIDTASSKSDPAVVAQQIKLRQNALSQAEQLMEYKRLITFHSSNQQKKKTKRNKGTGILSVFVSLLAEPLSKSGASRTDADHLTIELVLHLIRNLLSAHPLLNCTLTLFSVVLQRCSHTCTID